MNESFEANPMGSGFLFAAANRHSAPFLAGSVLKFLHELPEGIVTERLPDGTEQSIESWDEHVQLLVEGTTDQQRALHSAEIVSAGCAAAHELRNTPTGDADYRSIASYAPC